MEKSELWQNWIFPPTCEFRARFQCITLTYKNQVSSRVPFEALSPLYLHPLQQIKAKKVENSVRQIPVWHLMALYLVTMRYIGIYA